MWGRRTTPSQDTPPEGWIDGQARHDYYRDMKRSSEEVERYWEKVETEVGEKVLLYTLGRVYTPLPGYSSPLWGLFFLTPGSMFFRHFPRDGRIPFLGIGTGSPPGPPVTFSWNRDSFLRIEVLVENRLWKRLLSPSPTVILIEFRNEQGALSEFRFSLDRKQDEFLDILKLR